MKRTLAVLAFVLTLSVSVFAASATPTFTRKQVQTLAANAKSPADHLKVAAWYRAQSERLLAESDQHAKMAADFAANPVTNNAKTARATVGHCQYLAASLKAKSTQAAKIAAEHEQMAQIAAQK